MVGERGARLGRRDERSAEKEGEVVAEGEWVGKDKLREREPRARPVAWRV